MNATQYAPLCNEQLISLAPSVFAPQAHESRSSRYSYIPTIDLVDGMRNEGFMPVGVSQAKSRDEARRGFCKHLLRFRRNEHMDAQECRDIVLINSHDGSSGFRLMAGVFRFVCANGLIVGKSDNEIRVRHSGDAVSKVIEGAYSIVKDFDQVSASIEGMKALQLTADHQRAFAKAALAVRFEDHENSGFKSTDLLRPRRREDTGSDLWTTLNVVQESAVRGGMRGHKVDDNGRRHRVTTREINGIDQSTAVNRGLWVLAEEMRKLVA